MTRPTRCFGPDSSPLLEVTLALLIKPGELRIFLMPFYACKYDSCSPSWAVKIMIMHLACRNGEIDVAKCSSAEQRALC